MSVGRRPTLESLRGLLPYFNVITIYQDGDEAIAILMRGSGHHPSGINEIGSKAETYHLLLLVLQFYVGFLIALVVQARHVLLALQLHFRITKLLAEDPDFLEQVLYDRATPLSQNEDCRIFANSTSLGLSLSPSLSRS